ncbi:MAG: hypothetical protein M0R21_04800 [Lentimicrobiaceae bacterium]|nr:hypothetical protein [Lentimicrobiaceae bacterium]
MEKKKVIKSIDNLPPEVLNAINIKYPDGYINHVFKVSMPNNSFFHAITIDWGEISYLVKVPVKIDKPPANDFEILPSENDERMVKEDDEIKETEEEIE